MSLKLYNTFTNKEDEFKPIEEGKARFYTCGPTVYGRPHIGNYSSFLMADLLRRWLQFGLGYQVTHVKNITDVGHLVADADEGEDKVEKEARRIAKEKRGEDAEVTMEDVIGVAQMYTQQYLADEKALNMIEPEHRPRATETIQEMITMVKTLLDKGNAYETEDGIYFDVHSKLLTPYGKLSGNTLDNLESGSRVAVDENKKHPADFAIWKKCVGKNENHVLQWDSPWGAGFPGWHIECSAMSTKFLGEQIDIHTGGEDNIFPHHECEIAQSESASGKQFVRMWVHKRRIDLGNEKMSKSLGNVKSLDDISEAGFSPMDLRYLFLSVHYRTQLKFMEKGLEDAHKARRKIMEWMEEVEENESKEIKETKEYEDTFRDAMDADLNTPSALATVFDCMAWSRTESAQGSCKNFIEIVRNTFGCFDPEDDEEIPAEVQTLVDQRKDARDAKDFAASDTLRDQIKKLGYEVRDLPEGQRVEKL